MKEILGDWSGKYMDLSVNFELSRNVVAASL